MDYLIGTRCDPCTLRIRISSLKACTLRLQVIDLSQANTYLADRTVVTLPGSTHDCYVPMPVSPWQSFVRVFDQQGGPGAAASGYDVLEIRKMGLQTHLGAIGWDNAEVRQAIRFGRHLCYNMGWLPATDPDRAYCSPDGSLRLKYLDTLIDPKTGNESVTPMRISQDTSIMEASRKRCVPFTVGGRAVMYFHEYSHKYENADPDWELEADLNGLTIYLGLGYSRYEALQVYRDVFTSVPSPENTQRMQHIERFINDFEYYILTTKS